MMLEALKKLLGSSKVLMFLVFAVAITVARKLSLVDPEWYQQTIASAFYALLGGYSLVEAARAIVGKKPVASVATAKPAPVPNGDVPPVEVPK